MGNSQQGEQGGLVVDSLNGGSPNSLSQVGTSDSKKVKKPDSGSSDVSVSTVEGGKLSIKDFELVKVEFDFPFHITIIYN